MAASVTQATKPFTIFGRSKLWLSLALLVLFGLGLAIRLYDYDDPPLDFNPTRQLHSALMARGMYYQNLQGAPQWQRDLAVLQWKREGLIEPPIMEHLAALTYQIVGGEHLWIPRLYSILFWMLGGIAIFLLGREISTVDGGVVALAFYLFLPFGAIASRSFQPEPLMVACETFALWSAVRWAKTPTWKWAIIAGLLSGAVIFVKSVQVFFILPTWLALIFFGPGIRKSIKNPQVWVIAFLAVAPFAAFYIYGVYIVKLLESQFSLRFFPEMWKDPAFYLRWIGNLSGMIPFEWLVVALLSLFTVRQKNHRALLAFLWVGYFVYGMLFSYYIASHDYYQLPLVPVVALCLAAGAVALIENLRGPRWMVTSAVVAVLLATVVLKAWDVRVTLKRADYRNEPLVWQKISQAIPQGSSVIGLTQDYGYRIEYWGWLDITNWMTSSDFTLREMAGQTFDMKSLFEEQASGKDFFLVTLFGEYDSQPELKSLLEQGYPVYKKTGDYILFDLRHPLSGAQVTP
jgi:4-amino-4-deoxy-L-arabinose transferase-like glycosyltransferase